MHCIIFRACLRCGGGCLSGWAFRLLLGIAVGSLSVCPCASNVPPPAMALTLQGELVQAGFPDELWRLDDAIEFLEVEEFASLADLRGALHACCAHRLFHFSRGLACVLDRCTS